MVTIHGLDWQRAKWGGFATRFLRFGERMAAKYADEIIVLSASMQQYFADTYHRQTVRIETALTHRRRRTCPLCPALDWKRTAISCFSVALSRRRASTI